MRWAAGYLHATYGDELPDKCGTELVKEAQAAFHRRYPNNSIGPQSIRRGWKLLRAPCDFGNLEIWR